MTNVSQRKHTAPPLRRRIGQCPIENSIYLFRGTRETLKYLRGENPPFLLLKQMVL